MALWREVKQGLPKDSELVSGGVGVCTRATGLRFILKATMLKRYKPFFFFFLAFLFIWFNCVLVFAHLDLPALLWPGGSRAGIEPGPLH